MEESGRRCLELDRLSRDAASRCRSRLRYSALTPGIVVLLVRAGIVYSNGSVVDGERQWLASRWVGGVLHRTAYVLTYVRKNNSD